MTKALVWKEWREHRFLVLGGLFIAAMLPVFIAISALSVPRVVARDNLWEILRVSYLVVLWPWLAAAAGASTLVADLREGTIESLLSRPVGRLRLWTVKIVVAASAFAAVVGGSLGCECIFYSLLHGRVAWPPDFVEIGSGTLLTGREYVLFASFVGMTFSAGALISVLAGRAMQAAVGGVVLALGCSAAIAALCLRLDVVGEILLSRVVPMAMLAAAGFLATSLYTFASGEVLSTATRFRRAARGVLTWPVALALVGPAWVVAIRDVEPETAIFTYPSFSARDGSIAVTASLPGDGQASRIWLFSADGVPRTVLTQPLAFASAISADGKSVAYLTSRNAVGLSRRNGVDLRVVGIDGRGDRRVVSIPDDSESLGRFGERALTFSPDGQRIVVRRGYASFSIVAIDRSSTVDVDLAALSVAGPVVILGWSDDGASLVLCEPRPDGGISLKTYSPDVGRVETTFRTADDPAGRFWCPQEHGLHQTAERFIPLEVTFWDKKSSTGWGEIQILDRTSHELRTVARGDQLWVVQAGSRLAVAIGDEDYAGYRILEVPIDKGEPKLIATRTGWITGLEISPSGNSLIAVQDRGRHLTAIHRDGSAWPIETRGALLGWLGGDRLVLAPTEYPDLGVSFLQDEIIVVDLAARTTRAVNLREG